MMTDLTLETLVSILGAAWTEDVSEGLMALASSPLERDEYLATVPLASEGIEITLKEGDWIKQDLRSESDHSLFITAFHLYGPENGEFQEYKGALPGAIKFGNSEASVIRCLGDPVQEGGGMMSKVLGRMIPKWMNFEYQRFLVNCEFDASQGLTKVVVLLPET